MSNIVARNDLSNTLSADDANTYIVLKNSVYPGAKDESIAMVISYCKALKLDPLQKPVHIVPMWVKDSKTGKGEMRDVIMNGITLYRINASRSGCAGISEPEFGEDVTENLSGVDITYPKWCKITVKRIVQGCVVDFSAKEYWKENYATAGKDSQSPNNMWRKRPAAQLAKCTEAQAIRRAFPETCSLPTAEEMEGKSIYPDDVELPTVRISGISNLKSKLGIQEESAINDDTGEILPPTEKLQPGHSSESIKWLIESATSRKELNDTVKQVSLLPEDQKEELREMYRKRLQEIVASEPEAV